MSKLLFLVYFLYRHAKDLQFKKFIYDGGLFYRFPSDVFASIWIVIGISGGIYILAVFLCVLKDMLTSKANCGRISWSEVISDVACAVIVLSIFVCAALFWPGLRYFTGN